MKEKVDNPGDDPRYQTKKFKLRKTVRKAQRKSAKQRHHRNMLEWKQKRKQGNASLTTMSEEKATKKRSKGEAKMENDTVIPSNVKTRSSTYDDLEIQYLERQLLKNRKGVNKGGDLFSTLRSEFVSDGFDEEFLDFLSSINDLASGKGSKSAKKFTKSESIKEGSDMSDDDDDANIPYEEESEQMQDAEDSSYSDDESEEDTGKRKKVTFDLGTVEEKKANRKKTTSETRVESGVIKIDELQRKQIGLVNRISEGNFTIVVKELINMYNDVLSVEAVKGEGNNHLKMADDLVEDLCNCTVKMVIENEASVISLVAIHTTLICALCNTVGINVGYVYCHKLLKTMEKGLPILFKNEGEKLSETKLVIRNCVMSFAVMSHFDMLDIETIFFLIKNISREEITDHIAQILMVMLRHTGHKMKSQNQASFHNTIEHFNNLLERYKAEHGDISQSRLRFFEQEIQSFKLSKEKKPLETFDFLKNHLKGEFRYQGSSSNPQIEHQTLLKFTKVFDSTKTSSQLILKNLNTASLLSMKTSKKGDPNSTENLLQKASALRLYSNTQKSSFVALMGAIDPTHAVERIMDIGFKTGQYTEVVYTIVQSLICEKLYNEFYTAVTINLARLPSVTGKRFTRATVCTLIASIEHLQEKKPRKCSHLGRFFGTLVVGKVLELKLLRFLRKEHLDTPSVTTFLKSLFGYMVTQTDTDVEEHVIEQLLSIKNEDIYDLICELWYDYLQDHCSEKVISCDSGNIVLEACRRIFSPKSTS